MKTIRELEQGSESWHAFRADHFGASEAAAMLGISKYQTRAELLRRKATGIEPEVSPQLQAVFDRGHATEIGGRIMAQAIIGQELYPVTVSEGKLSASCDGLTMIEDIAFEHKQHNAALADSVRAGVLPAAHQPQCQQVMMLTGADKLLFMVSDGTSDNCAWMWVEPDPAIRKTLLQGWTQFAIDLEAYEHVEQTVAPSGRAPDSLPALLIEVTGMVTASNLDAFKSHAMTVFAGIKTALVTDADFADAEKTVKWCKEVEDRLDAAKSHALAQTASIDELFRVIDQIKEESRSKRLALDKLVKAEKDNRRAEIVRDAQDSMVKHIEKLNARIGGKFMPSWSMQIFNDAIRGLKSLDSMREKIGNAVRAETFAANDVADTIEANIKAIPESWKFLFSDMAQICTKNGEDFARLAESRIAVHEAAQAEIAEAAKKAEDARVAAAVEAERKAGEARAAAATEAEAKRVADAAKQAADDQRAKADAGVGLAIAGRAQPDTASSPPIQQSDMGQSLNGLAGKSVRSPTPDEMHKIIIDAGDVVRDFLNAQNVPDKERGRLRAFLMAFVQHQAGLAMKAAA